MSRTKITVTLPQQNSCTGTVKDATGEPIIGATIRIEGKTGGTVTDLDGYKKMINEAAATYPNFKAVATTLRQVKTATVNDWSAICWADGEIYKAAQYDGLEIMDRVGGGDSFASGLVYGLMTFEDAEKAVNYGAAHGALAMTTPGDTTMASLKEVEGIVGGAGARVQR